MQTKPRPEGYSVRGFLFLEEDVLFPVVPIKQHKVFGLALSSRNLEFLGQHSISCRARENPKSEYRNPEQIPTFKIQKFETFEFPVLILFRVSCFELRISLCTAQERS